MGNNSSQNNILAKLLILVLIYVILGNLVGKYKLLPNPIIPGAIIAINMIIPVIAGILYGKKIGGLTGLFGTFLNAISPAGNVFEFVAIVPHAVMGYSAGVMKEKYTTGFASFAIIIGHVLNILLFILAGIFEIELLANSDFKLGLLYETIFGIISIMIVIGIYRILFKK